MSFTGRVAIVSGAGRGVGRAHALAFARRNASVVVNDIDGEKATQVAAEIAAGGNTALAVAGDVSKRDVAMNIVAAAVGAFGRVDIIVNNAGIDRVVRTREVTATMMREFFDVHVVGAFEMCSAAWPHLVAQRYGRIVNTTSSAGYFGLARALPYSAAKGAVHGLTQTLAAEGDRHGITVNAVAPFAASRLARNRTQELPGLYEAIERFAPAESVSPAVLWLSHESTGVTGMAFEVGAGLVSRILIGTTPGISSTELSPEFLADNAAAAVQPSNVEFPVAGSNDRPLNRHLMGRG